ncbi:MAG: dCTP deaminase [Phycisphaerae bacterium]|nr:dCTP deaminase [Phycisphaerae bacterium]
MIFSDRQIKDSLASGRIVITPPPADEQFAPSAVDLHVGDEFKRWKSPPAGMMQQLRLTDVNIPDYSSFMEDLPREDDGSVVVLPHAFVLSQTLERVTLPANSLLAARVEGRSSYARLGLVVHMTAPTIHAGFEGNIVLEMMNFGPFPLRIDPDKTLLCQLIFEELGSDPACAINTPFQNQSGVLGEK